MRMGLHAYDGDARIRKSGGGRRGRGSAWLAMALLALLIAALVAGCGGGSDDSSATGASAANGATNAAADTDALVIPVAAAGDGPPEKTDLKWGILPTAEYAGVRTAISEGYFEKEGLNVETVVVNPASAIPALLGGSLDFSGFSWIGIIAALKEDIPITAVHEGTRGVPDYAQLLVRDDSPYQSLEDLVGKKVAAISDPGACTMIPNDVLHDDGVDGTPAWVEYEVPDMPAALARGDVEAACIPEPFLSGMLEEGGYRSVFDLFTGRFNDIPNVGYITSTEFAEENPNTIGAVRRALDAAFASIRKDPELVREILPTYTETPPAAARTMTLPNYPEVSDFSGLPKLGKVLNDVGLIEERVEVEAEPAG